jgi:hypothetical protein
LTDHTSSDCYEMWDLATDNIHTTRDIICLKRMHSPKISVTPPADGDDIQVTITVQRSSIEAGEGIPLVDSEATEVETIHKVETVHKDKTEEQEEDLEDHDKIPQLNAPRTRSG